MGVDLPPPLEKFVEWLYEQIGTWRMRFRSVCIPEIDSGNGRHTAKADDNPPAEVQVQYALVDDLVLEGTDGDERHNRASQNTETLQLYAQETSVQEVGC